MMDDEAFVEGLNEDLSQFYGETIDVLSGFREERYGEKCLIAKGATKEVYQVTDKFCEREVALAKIRREKVCDKSVLDFVR
ncbi:hypothetical protein [Rubritalea tangerina]|uniref:Uncharacterized protein n=1 Tax=Rubritalea tangerina TaxID=430798 RepID=A0ABW4ZEQ5_9BACT